MATCMRGMLNRLLHWHQRSCLQIEVRLVGPTKERASSACSIRRRPVCSAASGQKVIEAACGPSTTTKPSKALTALGFQRSSGMSLERH